MKRSDYPGAALPRKELHKRLMGAYQLAGRLLMEPLDDPSDVRTEMEIVLLDFLSDPTNADCDRLALAARGFATKFPTPSPTVTEGAMSAGAVFTLEPTIHSSCNVAGCGTCQR